MEKIATVFLDLDKIADSGQCFRWRKVGDREYIIPAYGKELHIKQDGPAGWLEFDCSREEYETVWMDYFDLKTNYARYAEELRTIKVPEYLREAEKAARGIRILRQDLWEVIVSFLISQNNNIPRIRQSLEKMCERFGGFPTAQQIAKAGPKGMSGLGLGYRDKYIIDAAIAYCGDGDGTTERILTSLSYDDAMEYLLTWRGIGEKVANCICLYGLGHKEAFPRDVWIKRIEAEHFGGHFPDEDFPEYAGVLQQFIYYYERSRKNGRDKET